MSDPDDLDAELVARGFSSSDPKDIAGHASPAGGWLVCCQGYWPISGHSGPIEFVLQLVPVLRQITAAHHLLEDDVAIVANTLLAGEAQPEDQQHLSAIGLEDPKEKR
jgi:hypothetical protein